MTNDKELPPLPEPSYIKPRWRAVGGAEYGEPFFDTAKTQAYARQAVEADRAQRVPVQSQLLGIVRTAQSQAERIANKDFDGSSHPHRDLRDTLAVIEYAISQRVEQAGPVVKVFTYKAQPDNVGAWRMGAACCKAAAAPAGDYIDSGLVLLRELQEKGYGVVPLAVPSFGATQDSPTKAVKVGGPQPSPVVAPPGGAQGVTTTLIDDEKKAERERFEGWLALQGTSRMRLSSGEYVDSMARLWWGCWLACARRAALTGREGWKLMPTAPTEEIMRAMCDAFIPVNGDTRKAFAECYPRMLAAAPEFKGEKT